MNTQNKSKRMRRTNSQPFSALIDNSIITELSEIHDGNEDEGRLLIQQQSSQDILSRFHKSLLPLLLKTRKFLQSHKDAPQPLSNNPKDNTVIWDIVTNFYIAEQNLFDYLAASGRSQPSTLLGMNELAVSDTLAPQIQVRVGKEEIRIFMPHLRPRVLASRPEALATKQLMAVLEKEKLPKWPKWEASFLHVYSPSKRRTPPPDVDNYDYKRTIDVIALMLRTTDRGGRFRMEADTLYSDVHAPGTYIRIRPKNSDFWLETPMKKDSTANSEKPESLNKSL